MGPIGRRRGSTFILDRSSKAGGKPPSARVSLPLEFTRLTVPGKDVRCPGISFAVVVLCGIGIALYWAHQPTPAQSAPACLSLPPVHQTIDLSTSASTRGTPAEAPFASLPRRTVELTLILPALTQTGPYSVAVSKTTPAMQPAATATGTAFEQDRQTRLKVTLHMGVIEPGLYYLSTTNRENGVAYYYPLKVVP